MKVFIEEDQFRARHPGQPELHRLARAVHERGPAVFLVPRQPSAVFLDEMAHVVSKAVEPASGPGPAGRPQWLYEPLRPLPWCPEG